MGVLHQFIRRGRDHRGCGELAICCAVAARKAAPDPGEGEGRARGVAGHAKPDIGRRVAPLRLAKAGGRDEAAAFGKTGFPEGRAAQLIIPRIVHRLGLDRLAGFLGGLRQYEPPMRIAQHAVAIVIERHDGRRALRKDRRQRLCVAQLVVFGAHFEQLPHEGRGEGIRVEVTHFRRSVSGCEGLGRSTHTTNYAGHSRKAI